MQEQTSFLERTQACTCDYKSILDTTKRKYYDYLNQIPFRYIRKPQVKGNY